MSTFLTSAFNFLITRDSKLTDPATTVGRFDINLASAHALPGFKNFDGKYTQTAVNLEARVTLGIQRGAYKPDGMDTI